MGRCVCYSSCPSMPMLVAQTGNILANQVAAGTIVLAQLNASTF